MIRTSQTDIAYIEMLPGNIFHVTITKGAEVTLESARRLVQATNEMLEPNNRFRGGVYDMSSITYIHADARDFLANGNGIVGEVTGVALIANSYLGKMIGNLFITLGNPKSFPVKFFDSPFRAEHWVRKQMETAKKNASCVRKVA